MNNTTHQSTPASVLRSVAHLTGQRDRDLLAQTLVDTLSELIHSRRISLYRVLSTDQGIEALLVVQTTGHTTTCAEMNWLIGDRPDFQAVLDSGKEHLKSGKESYGVSIYPISNKQHIVGLLEIFSESHSEIDKILISSFLKVYSNYLTILDESETDTLTGLLNRRTFENNIEKIITEQPKSDENNAEILARRTKDTDSPHWLAVMDIDFFKRINDKFGHLYGDEVLLLLSRCMKRVFRQRDKLFRFGGEEFIVVLDRTNLEGAKLALERFRLAIENYDFPQVGRVTISIGFVMLQVADVPSSLVGRADQALYFAKEHGRNQVCFYGDLVSTGELSTEKYSDDMQLF